MFCVVGFVDGEWCVFVGLDGYGWVDFCVVLWDYVLVDWFVMFGWLLYLGVVWVLFYGGWIGVDVVGKDVCVWLGGFGVGVFVVDDEWWVFFVFVEKLLFLLGCVV